MSKKHGARKKRRNRKVPVKGPKKALLEQLAAQGVTEVDWRRIQRARLVVHEVNDAIAARGGSLLFCIVPVAPQDKTERPPPAPAMAADDR